MSPDIFAQAMGRYWRTCGFNPGTNPSSYRPPYLYEPSSSGIKVGVFDFARSCALSATPHPKTVRLEATWPNMSGPFEFIVTRFCPVALPDQLSGKVVTYQPSPEWYGEGRVVVPEGASPMIIRFVVGTGYDQDDLVSSVDFDFIAG